MISVRRSIISSTIGFHPVKITKTFYVGVKSKGNMSFKRIVVATDFSQASLVAVETAFSLALEDDGIMYLVHVMKPYVIDNPIETLNSSLDRLREEIKQKLKALTLEKGAHSGRVVVLVLSEAAPAKAIAQLAREKDADLIVVGTHGRKGVTRAVMGSTAESLLRQSPCQVLVVKQKTGTARKDVG